MKLMTNKLQRRFTEVGSQEHKADPIVITKYFNPVGRGVWLATEFNPETRIFFGYVSIYGDHCDEWGYFSLDELKMFKGLFGLGIERDLYFTEQPSSEIISILTHHQR